MEFRSRFDSSRFRAAGVRVAVPALLSAGAMVLAASSAAAQQRLRGSGDNQCAVYGAGFVAVQGTGTCVRIGGRVRLEVGGNRVSGNAYAPGGFPAAAAAHLGGASQAGDGVNRAHMRIEGPLARSRR